MADLFISYAKTDWQRAARLAAFLEAQGWSVWWDKALQPGDRYRSDIARELALARAVLVIWTAASAESDWVRAEAGSARNAGKLIPVKARDVAYADIPLPFGELHTENVDSEHAISLAVETLLASKPLDTGFRTKVANVRYQLFTWLGIVGGALTVFANLGAFVRLADWSTWLVAHWTDVSHAALAWLASRIGFQLSRAWAPALTFLIFFGALLVGLMWRDYGRQGRKPSLKSGLKNAGLYLGAVALWCLFVASIALAARVFARADTSWLLGSQAGKLIGYLLSGGSFAVLFLTPVALFWRQRSDFGYHLFNFAVFYVLLFTLVVTRTEWSMSSSVYSDGEQFLLYLVVVIGGMIGTNVFALISLSLADPRSLAGRLVSVCIGLAGLLGLNLVSVYGGSLLTSLR